MKRYLPGSKELVTESQKLSELSKSSIKFRISLSVSCFLLSVISEFPTVTAFSPLPDKFMRGRYIPTNWVSERKFPAEVKNGHFWSKMKPTGSRPRFMINGLEPYLWHSAIVWPHICGIRRQRFKTMTKR